MTETMLSLHCRVKEYRLKKGLSQEMLANMVAVRRQAIYDIESGKYLPNTAVALKLARTLGCTVEMLFTEQPTAEKVHLLGAPASASARLALSRIRDELIGIPLQGQGAIPFTLCPSDGILCQDGKSVELLHPGIDLAKTILILGCDPALAILQNYMANSVHGLRAHTIFASSSQALQTLAKGAAHVAGTHFHNTEHSEANLDAVKAAMPNTPCSVIAFSLLEEGLMVAPNNPLKIKDVDDLAETKTRFVNREKGAALRKLLDTRLEQKSISPSAIAGYETEVSSHCEGAFHVACKTAGAALGLRVIAESFGLGFVPLAVTRCDLVIPLDLHDSPGIALLLDRLQSSSLHRELLSLPGYDASCTGKVIE